MTGVRRRAPKSRAMHAAMVIAVGFALIILAGALLLMLPCAAKSGRATPFIDALFTATSATCVTGLVTVSTGRFSANALFSCSSRSAASALCRS